jgi:hypothetical protein
VNTYVNEILLYFFLNKCATFSKSMFSLCHCGVLCVDGWENVFFMHFILNIGSNTKCGISMNTFWRHCKYLSEVQITPQNTWKYFTYLLYTTAVTGYSSTDCDHIVSL